MMKNIFKLLIVFLSFSNSLFAQYSRSNVDFGKYADGTPVKATFFNMENGLDSVVINNDLHYLILTDKEHNQYVLHSVDLHQIALIKNKDDIFFDRNGYLECYFFKTKFFDFNKRKLRSLPITAIYRNDSMDVIIGYNKSNSMFKGNISAYRISNGELLWNQKLPHYYHWPWECTKSLESQQDQLYLITDSLIKLDIMTGATIKMPFTSGLNEPFKSRFSFVMNRKLLRVDWREAYMAERPYIADFVLSDTHSNFLLASDSIFIADAKNIYCLDKQLNKIWMTSLPKDAGSKSNIKFIDNKIVITNYGVAFQKGLLAHCGKPFVAEYDRHSGKELDITFPDIKNKLSDAYSVSGRTYWKDDKGYMYNDFGKSEIHRVKWEAPIKVSKYDDKKYDCYYWPVDTLYTYSDGSLKPILTDNHQLILDANEQDVYILKDDGTQQIIKAEDAFFRESNNVYSNNAEKRKTFYVTDGSTTQVRLTLKFEGDLIQDKNCRLYAVLSNGLGVIEPMHFK